VEVFKIAVWLKETSMPKVFEKAINAYQKGDLYCIFWINEEYPKGHVTKYPLNNIWKIDEEYYCKEVTNKE